MTAEHLEAASEAEAVLQATHVWTLAEPVNTHGARLSFTFWNHYGALTLIGFSAQGLTGPAAAPVDAEEAQRALSTVLSRYPRRHVGEVTLTLQREQARWAVDYGAFTAPRPPEARTLPVSLLHFPADSVRASTEGLQPLLNAIQVPTGGEAWAELEALLEDGRVEGWRLRIFQLSRGSGKPRPLSPRLTHQMVRVLLPFTLGLGPRTVRLRLHLAHHAQEPQAHGWVESASVERPPPLPQQNAALVAEYRAMHELILWQWRHEVKEGSAWVAQRGIEEVALWYAGGLFLKGGGYLARWAGSVTRRALARGAEAAAGWLRTTLSRLPGDQKRLFERLWSKAHLEGERALTAEERTTLRRLIERVEQVAQVPLDDATKNSLRRAARESYAKLHPEFVAIMEEFPQRYPVHHRRPLEYAHLFPDEDINAASNLALVENMVHKRINQLWTKLRSAREKVSAEDVNAARSVIDNKFERWYDRVNVPKGEEKLIEQAQEAALKELSRRFPELR